MTIKTNTEDWHDNLIPFPGQRLRGEGESDDVIGSTRIPGTPFKGEVARARGKVVAIDAG